MRDIKISKVLEFDLHVLSSQIDSGCLWGEPEELEDVMVFYNEKEEYSKSQPLPQAIQYFFLHDSNF